MLIAFIVLAGLLGPGILAWRVSLWARFSNAAEVSKTGFLGLKKAGQVKEVWLEKNERYVDVAQGFVRDGRSFDRVHAVVSPAYLLMPQGMNELRSGIDPSRLHVGPEGSWGFDR